MKIPHLYFRAYLTALLMLAAVSTQLGFYSARMARLGLNFPPIKGGGSSTAPQFHKIQYTLQSC
jgi:hypothetical protein